MFPFILHFNFHKIKAKNLGPAMSTSAITQYPVNITPASSSVSNTAAYTPSSLIVSSQNLNFGAQQMANTPNHYVSNTQIEPINPTLNLANSSISATSSNPTSSDPNTPASTSILKLEPQENLSELLSKEYKLVCEGKPFLIVQGGPKKLAFCDFLGSRMHEFSL
jgi:hypothetical protein